jgi:DNA repair exonuclease SbcCD nuclease subunit
MRFVHAADIHLDSPLRGLERYEGAPIERVRGATRRAFENLVRFCIDERVAFLLLSGDLYDGDWRDFNTGLFFVAQMAKLREANIPVVLVRGNHDAESQVSKNLRLPDGVHELATKSPSTVRLDAFGVAVHGQGYAARDEHRDLGAGYPRAIPGMLNIGLLHTALSGREGHAPYAPCTVEGLRARGYDYWALGHVHKREEVHADPLIVFPGNLQGRHARETGPKGATLVTVDDRELSARHVALDVLRWAVVAVDVGGAEDEDAVLSRVSEALERERARAEERPVAARVVLTGRARAHAAMARSPDRFRHEVRAIGADLGDVWVEKVELATQGHVDVEALLASEGPAAALLRALRDVASDDAALASLVAEFRDVRERLQSVNGLEDALVERAPELDLTNDRFVKDALADVEALLLASFVESEAASSRGAAEEPRADSAVRPRTARSTRGAA